jgi:hypothetical protein
VVRTLCLRLQLRSQYHQVRKCLINAPWDQVLEKQGCHAEATWFAQTNLQDYHKLNVPAKVRAGRVLGR